MEEFSASLDKRSKFFTLFGFLIIFVVVLQFVFNSEFKSESPSWVFYLVILLPPLSLLIPYLFRPIKYVVTENQIIIKRPVKSVTINISDIKKIEILNNDDLKGTIRVFGSGGFFGYYGKFRNKNFGMMKFFATRYSNFIYILTSEGINIIITPDNPNEFLKKMQDLKT